MKKALFAILFALTVSLASYSVVVPEVSTAAKNNTKIGVAATYLEFSNTVDIFFYNLSKVKTVSYTLTYQANGITQGVVGTTTVNGQVSIIKSIFLGTCSQNSCVPHENPTNFSLNVTTTYKSGKVTTANYPVN